MQSNRRLLVLSAIATAAAMTATGAFAQGGPRVDVSTSRSGMKVNFSDLKSETTSFTTGNPDAKKVAYIFVDPQCSHCAAQWAKHLPLQDKAKFVWIPVGLLNRASIAQGATILGSSDPAKAMAEHETLLSANKGGITANSDAMAKFSDAIKSNSEFLRKLGARGVPFTIYRDPETRETVTESGVQELVTLMRL